MIPDLSPCKPICKRCGGYCTEITTLSFSLWICIACYSILERGKRFVVVTERK